MVEQLDVREFLEKSKTIPIIDVRSPAEYFHGKIPQALHNIALFSNEERAAVGTKYKQVSKDAAVLLGLEYVGPKLATFVKQARKIAVNNEILVYCWRGGMRSSSFAWLLNTAGIKVSTLMGGYKSYRNFALNYAEQPLKIVVLGGKTGSGKTEILHELKKLGEQVLDLEGLSHHKGSAFGALGQKNQPSTEYFENLILEALSTFDLSKRIWIEDESKHIGSCNINNALWHQMRKAPLVFIEISKEERINRLVKEYANFPFDELQTAIDRIKKRLGGDLYQAALAALSLKDYHRVAAISLAYYDKSYLIGLEKRENKNIHLLDFKVDLPTENAQKLKAWANINLI